MRHSASIDLSTILFSQPMVWLHPGGESYLYRYRVVIKNAYKTSSAKCQPFCSWWHYITCIWHKAMYSYLGCRVTNAIQCQLLLSSKHNAWLWYSINHIDHYIYTFILVFGRIMHHDTHILWIFWYRGCKIRWTLLSNGFTFIQIWISNHKASKVCMQLLIHSQISTAASLKFGN